MLENLGGWEFVTLIVVALLILGPERLPKAISEGLGALRRLRAMARNATADLSREMGTPLELEDLHPKTLLRKHLLSEAEEDALRRPFDDVMREVRGLTEEIELPGGHRSATGGSPPAGALPTEVVGPAGGPAVRLPKGAVRLTKGAAGGAPRRPGPRTFDDAT